MAEKNDGGPAFPNWDEGPVGSEGALGVVPTPGMSLRDYFAGQALCTIADFLAYRYSGDHGEADRQSAVRLARHAYFLADAMLTARSTPTGAQT